MELCNLVLAPLNEVLLTQATFSSATGFHNSVKNWVNEAIQDINQAEIEWPFNYTSTSQTLTAETSTYDYPSDVEWIDWESFHLEEDDALTVKAKHLEALSYDEWNIYNRANDETSNSGIRIPQAVVKRPNLKWGVTPIPDRAYTISFDYYAHPSDLSAYDDATAVPDRFKNVIKNRALWHAYMFRDNVEAANVIDQKYEQGLANMRTVLINKYDRINDTRTTRSERGYKRLGFGD